MIELLSPRLSTEITLGLLNIEQIAYVLLVLFLALILGDEFLSLRMRTKRFFLWAAIGFASFLFLFSIFVRDLGVEMAPLAASFAAAMVLGVMSHVFALSFFSASLLLRPWELLPGSDVMLMMPQALFYLCLISGLLYCFRARKFAVVWSKEIFLLLFFAFWVYLSIFQSSAWQEAHADFMGHFTRTILLFLLIMNLVREKKDFLALSASVAWSCSVLALLTVYRMRYDPALQGGARAELFGLIGDPNDISALLLLALPMVLCFVTRQFKSTLPRLAVGGAIFVTTVWIITLTQSRGAMLALIALVTVYALTRAKTRAQMMFFSVLILLGGFGLQGTLHRSASDLEASQSGRMSYWKAGVQMAIRHPVFGVGYQNFARRLPEYVDVRFSEAGKRTAHSTWILLMAETGFVGLGLFSLLFYWALRASWKMLPRHPDLFFSLVGYGSAFSFLSHSYVLMPYLLLAIVFAASRIDTQDLRI